MFDFDSKGYDAQIISIGSFIDRDQAPKLYQVDCMVLRLNGAALDGYTAAHRYPDELSYRSCEEREAAMAARTARIDAWERKMRAIVGLEDVGEGVNFARITAEVFGMTWIRKLEGADKDGSAEPIAESDGEAETDIGRVKKILAGADSIIDGIVEKCEKLAKRIDEL